MTDKLTLMTLPSDILQKFTRNFKMALVNKECNTLRKKMVFGFNPRAQLTVLLIQELKVWILQQLFYQTTGYHLNIVSAETVTKDNMYIAKLNQDDLVEMWDDLEIPGIELLESLI